MPVDGQQRLTTLTLLAWVLNHKSGYSLSDRLPSITYMTRPSTEQFCHHLLKYELKSDYTTISDHIKTIPGWFSERWLNDPSIRAMLDFLDKADSLLSEPPYRDKLDVMTDHFFNSSPITFERLDMNALNLNDDLYIKMNARGKLLTAFENWKAGFEGFLSDNFSDERYDFNTIPGIDEQPTLSQYFEYAVEHDWCDMLWPIAFDRWNSIDENNGLKATYPRIDESFMNLLDFISRFMFYSSIDDADKLAKQKQTDIRGLYDDRKEDSRQSVYNAKDNIVTLFRMLDILVMINKPGNSADFFNKLFITRFDKEETQKTYLYNSSSTDLFRLCIDGSLETSTEVLFWAILKYLLHHPGCITTPDSAMTDYVRVMVGWIRARRQRLTNGLSVRANVRQSDFHEADEIITLLADAPDMFATLATTAHQSLEGERRKSRYHSTDKHRAVCILSNLPELYSCFNLLYDSLNQAADTDAYIDRFLDFINLDDLRRIKILNSHGFTGIETMHNHWFYGVKGKWDFVFTASNSDNGFKKAVDALSAYMNGSPSLTFTTGQLPYYIDKYPEFINARNAGNTDTHYLIGQSISPFRLWAVKTFSTMPIRGYNVDPYGFTVQERYQGPLRLWAESDNSTHGVLFINKEALVIECVDNGWQIKNFDRRFKCVSNMLNRFNHVNGSFSDSRGQFTFVGDIFLDLPECDRIETAIEFLKALE